MYFYVVFKYKNVSTWPLVNKWKYKRKKAERLFNFTFPGMRGIKAVSN